MNTEYRQDSKIEQRQIIFVDDISIGDIWQEGNCYVLKIWDNQKLAACKTTGSIETAKRLADEWIAANCTK